MNHIYFAVDGDDVGRRLEYFMLVNDASALTRFSTTFRKAMVWLESELIQNFGATILFSGGDNLLAYFQEARWSINDFEGIRIQFAEQSQNTISIGLGGNLRQAYFALKLAKAAGKNCIRQFQEFPNE